ncbi:MAG: flagellar protein FlaG [Lachnospiraceae bacterium]
MGIEAVKSAGAAYQTASSPEVVKEASQPKSQVIDIQTGSAALAAEAVELNTKDTGEQQGSNQETQSRANAENIKKAVEQINKKSSNSEAIFGIHEKTNRVTIKIVDKTTKEVIKEFPPEETLDMIAKAWELAGIMVDEKR